MRLTVIVPAHNPDRHRIAATLEGLRKQTLPLAAWDLIVVDNASHPPIAGDVDLTWHPQARLVIEPQLGLTRARLRGIAESAGDAVVFIDDDNVLAPNFLAVAVAELAKHPEVGVAGGRIQPRFDREPPAWTREFFGNLAICDHGLHPIIAPGWTSETRLYPACAPAGAGMVVRQSVAHMYAELLRADSRRQAFDRQGRQLVSGGDNDIVMTALSHGWSIAYWPKLGLEHLIPAARLKRSYLSRLNYSIARSWVGGVAAPSRVPLGAGRQMDRPAAAGESVFCPPCLARLRSVCALALRLRNFRGTSRSFAIVKAPLRKIRTALKLLLQLDGRRLRTQWTYNVGRWRVRRHRSQPFVFRDLGFPFVCHPEWVDSLEHFCGERASTPDELELRLIRRWLRPGDSGVDAGANLGFYTFAASTVVGSTGVVVAIDADAYVVEKLRSAAALLGQAQVRTEAAALTAAGGPILFYQHAGQRTTTTQSLRPPPEDLAQSAAVSVTGRTLVEISKLWLTDRIPAFVKVDIEGAECDALRATPAEWLNADGPLWIVEVNPTALDRFEATPFQLLDRFAPSEFERWLLPKCPLRPLFAVPDDHREIKFTDSLYYNLIAVPRGARFRDRRARIEPFLTKPRRSNSTAH